MIITAAQRLQVRQQLEEHFKMPLPEHIWRIALGLSRRLGKRDLIEDYLESKADGEPIEAWRILCKELLAVGLAAEQDRQEMDSVNDPGTLSYPYTHADGIRADLGGPQQADAAQYADLLRREEVMLLDAMIQYCCWDASEWEPVKAFRQRYLHGGALSFEESERFLLSPTLRLLNGAELAVNQVDIVEHITDEHVTESVWEKLSSHAESIEYTLRLMPHRIDMKVRHSFGIAKQSTFVVPAHLAPSGLMFVDGKECSHWPQPILFFPGTVLDEVQNLSKKLAHRYGWNVDDALWFLLSDKAPILEPTVYPNTISIREWKATDESAATVSVPHSVSLTVPIHLSPETLAEIFRRVQRNELGQRVRAVDEKRIRLLGFVAQMKRRMNIVNEPSRAEARSILHKWNDACLQEKPEWVYQGLHRFNEDYQRTKRVIFNPWTECQRRRVNKTEPLVAP